MLQRILAQQLLDFDHRPGRPRGHRVSTNLSIPRRDKSWPCWPGELQRWAISDGANVATGITLVPRTPCINIEYFKAFQYCCVAPLTPLTPVTPVTPHVHVLLSVCKEKTQQSFSSIASKTSAADVHKATNVNIICVALQLDATFSRRATSRRRGQAVASSHLSWHT